jgi:hypothetical protein
MERIHYAGSSVLTGSRIARSLVGYAEALALRKGAMSVDIPIRRASGELGRATLLIGPASQLFSETEDDGGEEIVDTALVERLTNEAARLGVSQPLTEEGGSSAPQLSDLEIPRFDSDDDRL